MTLLTDSAPQASSTPNWEMLAREIIDEHNKVRQNPQSYIPILEAHLARMDENGNIPNGCGPNCTLTTQEGKAAVLEAIEFLKKQPALDTLSISTGVAQAAIAHAEDQKNGATGHTGSDKSTPGDRFRRFGVTPSASGENIDYGSKTAQDVVMSLIIDDGVKSRGHRDNIFDARWNMAGAGCGSHAKYGTVSVIGYIDDAMANKNPLMVVHNGSVDLLSIEMGGVDILGGPLSPGQSREIALNPKQRQGDLKLQLAGGYSAMDWKDLTLCGATLTVNENNSMGIQSS